jgi:hypothetical protein
MVVNIKIMFIWDAPNHRLLETTSSEGGDNLELKERTVIITRIVLKQTDCTPAEVYTYIYI